MNINRYAEDAKNKQGKYMKSSNKRSFFEYCTYREDLGSDLIAQKFGKVDGSMDNAAHRTLNNLIKEIWEIDRRGVVRFFKNYKDDPRVDTKRISELLDELEGGRPRSSSDNDSFGDGDMDQIVPAQTDNDGGDEDGGGGGE